ncbi:hypothetical protein [Streptomyces sp. NPDC126514]|uniref:hypothetical protein n=1 Tax=Streptomyces sp. NPDC126514 TaxID=3155210 RepID=UPI00332C6B8E
MIRPQNKISGYLPYQQGLVTMGDPVAVAIGAGGDALGDGRRRGGAPDDSSVGELCEWLQPGALEAVLEGSFSDEGCARPEKNGDRREKRFQGRNVESVVAVSNRRVRSLGLVSVVVKVSERFSS